MHPDTPHGDNLDPAAAALAALAAAHRGLSARESSATDRRLVYAAITTAGRDVLDKATPVLAAIAREHIASRLPAADLGQLTQALRTIAGTSPPQASQRPGETT